MISVHVLDSLAEAAARHAAQLGYAAQQNLFASIEWFQCLAAHGFGAPVRPRIYVAHDDTSPEEMAFLFCMADTNDQALASLTNYSTMEFAPAFAPGAKRRRELTRALVAHIAEERPRWRQVNVRLLHEAEPASAWLIEDLATHGFPPHRYFQFENYHVDVTGQDFKTYFESRPSRMRNTIRRREKKLRAEHNVAVEILDAYDKAKVDDYMAVYRNSWKESEGIPAFIYELCRTASGLGLLRLGLLYVDGVPAAAQLWLISGPKGIIYKLAYDEKYKDFSVGSILTRDILEHVLSQDRLTELDYGVGSEPYKRDWMDRTRRIVGLQANNRRTVMGSARAFGQWARNTAKAVVPARAARES
jgi:hypothetical protein